jgi:hypothetical protein
MFAEFFETPPCLRGRLSVQIVPGSAELCRLYVGKSQLAPAPNEPNPADARFRHKVFFDNLLRETKRRAGVTPMCRNLP